MVYSANMTEDVISAALEEVRGRILQIQHQDEELKRALSASKEEERLLLQLLALRRDPTRISDASSGDGRHVPDKAGESLPSRSLARPKPVVIEAVARELASAGRPIHISELMRLLDEKHVIIPGAGTQANLITHLRRDPRFVRPSRGMYGLAAWGLQDMPANTNRRRRKRRVRSSGTSSERK